ncbi:MAG TPA: multiheme c-type cytochrome, partial [Planctomycetia bacterium]|nr:multiheme c-type cytochrome [Planctomycetia bacterium]
MTEPTDPIESPIPVPPSKPKARKAIGPKLRIVFWLCLGFLALLIPNSAFMGAITYLQWNNPGETYQDQFYTWMFLAHLGLGILLVVPFLIFGLVHMVNTWRRKNYRAVRVGYALFAACLVILVSGFLLVRIEGAPSFRDGTTGRQVVYWLHVAVPLVGAWLYWLHRLAGPKIKWRVGVPYLGVVGATVALMVWLKVQDPRQWNKVGSPDGLAYFHPSLARTNDGKFISQEVLQADDYCMKCHKDAYDGWFHSAHHFSSFNNPAYLASVRETRKFSLERDGNVRAARWCAGCHDPAPFFSGKFDDPKYDDVRDPTAHAGITCTTCHAITNVNTARGNGDYTIEEPVHYPFAFSKNPLLQWINNQLVKAKPDFHKKTFLKPLHKSSEFCSTCHKVHLPEELNHYKWLRGQNHYDSFLLSGQSGHGARSFYYPQHSRANCAECHMPLQESKDFGARDFDKSGKLKIHDHFFPGANFALPHWQNRPDLLAKQTAFQEGVMRVDLFGLREGGTIDGELHAPLRPNLPTLKPGRKYLLETVLRTLNIGHHFTQGTVDSNEVWLDVTISSGGKVIGRSGGRDAAGAVDPYSHFVNVYMLDRNGKRIDRRNPQNIFTPLYNNQIPPGAGFIVHYELKLPEKLAAPLTIEAKLQYRKFDATYM